MAFTINVPFTNLNDAGRRILLGRVPREDLTVSFGATGNPLPDTWDFLGTLLLERTSGVSPGVFYEQNLYRGLNAWFSESIIRDLVNPGSSECFNLWLISVPWLRDGVVTVNSRGTECTT